MQNLILVNKDNNQIGTKGKLESHLGKGILHRAFTCILINSKGKLLLTKRSLKKPLFPTFWDLSFSSHPWDGEDLEVSVIRRARQELDIKIDNPKLLFNYYYQAKWSEIFSEHEINHIFLAKFNPSDDGLTPHPEEISEHKWISLEDFKKLEKKDNLAPWIAVIKDRILESL